MPPTCTLTGPSAATGAALTACAACGGPLRDLWLAPPATVACGACGLAQLKEPPCAEARAACYQDDYYAEDTGVRFVKAFEWPFHLFRRLRHLAIERRAPRRGAILDVGCGRGDLLETFQRQGWRALGTQLSRTAAEAARRRRGVDVVVGELPALDLPAASFDAVTFFHVLEHLADPRPYLIAARRALTDDGLLVIEVPDCSSPGFRALKTRSFTFDHPHHLLFFTPPTLRALVEACGFEVAGQSRFSLEYSPYTTLQNILNLLPGQPSRLYRALMRNARGRALRRSPWTWVHATLACALAVPALAISLCALFLPVGNTLRLYCRKAESAPAN